MSFPRRLRGVLVTSLLWAVAWLPIGILHGLLQFGRLRHHLSAPFEAVPLDAITWPALAWTTLGAISGAGFAVALMIAERRRSLHTLSLGRVSAWGGLGALCVPILLAGATALQRNDLPPAEVVATLCIVAGLGAASAAVTLGMARRGADVIGA